MIVRHLCLVLLSGAIPLSVSAKMCQDIFQKNVVLLNNYNEVSIDVRETVVKKEDAFGIKKGTVWMTGTYGVLGRDVISKVDYKIQSANLRLTSVVTKSEYYGQNVFSEMIRAIVAKNPSIKTITASINGEFYARYLKDLALSNNPAGALSANPVVMQLALTGFTVMSSSIEIPSGSFMPSILIVMSRTQ